MKKRLYWVVFFAVVFVVMGLADAAFARSHKSEEPVIFINLEQGFEGDPTGGFWSPGGGQQSNAEAEGPSDNEIDKVHNAVTLRDAGRLFLRSLFSFALGPHYVATPVTLPGR